MMSSNEVRSKFLKFFEDRGHKIVPSASLVPENDPTTLFTGSGMQPMVPYLLGKDHPLGKRLADSQKCFRGEDIEEVGDNRHTTFFEMLGNWSLGDYFKEEQIKWFFEFLTDELKIDPNRLFITVFAGDESAGLSKDDEAAGIWKNLFAEKGIQAEEVFLGSEEDGAKQGMQDGRIFYYDSSKNWWSRGGTPDKMPAGEPGGPDSEVFYMFEDAEHDPAFGEHCHPNCDCGRFIEIGNNVFMQYRKESDGTFSALPKQNIDFGGGLERVVAAVADVSDVFRIDTLRSIIEVLEEKSGSSYDSDAKASFRVVADHMRGAVFMIADGVVPSNTEAGYFTRRLIRRSVRHADKLGYPKGELSKLTQPIVDAHREQYPELATKQSEIEGVLKEEEERFRKRLEEGMKKFEKIAEGGGVISGADAFLLFSTYGFPVEITRELAEERGIEVDTEAFEKEYAKHQEVSRAGSEDKFKGGLADTSEKSVEYHTATHLLHQALRDVLGDEVRQKGSNITPERLRFDFAFSRKMTDEEKSEVERIVNEKIGEALPVNSVELSKDEAVKTGALHFFGEKYGDMVNVYFIGNSPEDAYSKEFCGGPHVSNTADLQGCFSIKKEEAVSAGVRRIKAVLV